MRIAFVHEYAPLLRAALAALAMCLAVPAQAQEAEWKRLGEEFAALYRQKNYAEAADVARREITVAESTFGPDDPRVARSLDNLAAVFRVQRRWAQAEPLYRRSLDTREKALGPDHPDVARSLGSLALLYQSQGRRAQAEPLFKRALSIREKALGPDHPDVAAGLNNLGVNYSEQGQYAQAEPLIERALAIWEKAYGTEHPVVTNGASNLALIYRRQGRYAKAEPLLVRSLAAREKALGPDHPDVAASLNSLAVIYLSQAQYAKAAPLLQRALATFEKARGPDHPDVAASLNILGEMYRELGQYAKAEPYYQRALAILEKARGPDHATLAPLLNNLALLNESQGKVEQAEALFMRSLATKEKALGPDHPQVATSLNNLAVLLESQGRHAQAEALYRRSLAISEKALGPDHPSIAGILNNLATQYRRQGQFAQAEPLLMRALQVAIPAPVPPLQSLVNASLAKLHAASGQSDLAILFGKRAVNTLQSFRAMNVGLDDEAKRSSLKKNESVYTTLADLLIAQGRLPEAQQVMAMLKEEEYFDFVRRSGKDDARTTRVGFNEREAAWQASLEAASSPLATLGREKGELDRLRKGGLSPEQEKRLGELEDQLKGARQRFDDTTRQIIADARRQAGGEAMRTGAEAIESLRAWRGTLREMGEGTVLLTYVMAPERLWIILTTPEVQVARKSDIGAAELNKLVFDFRRVLSSPQRLDARPAAQALHKHLIGPVADELEAAKARTLMVSLDGSLRYVPVGALHDGKQYLVERYRTAMLTEAAKTQINRKPVAKWSIAGMGLTHAVTGFEALPGVKEELDGLVRVGKGGGGVLPGEIYLDERFTSKQLQAVLGAQERPVLHIASHFHFTPGADAESFLVLGDGSRLTLREVRDADLRFDHVDLLTLSACETAVGDNAQGREVEGLGALAQKQGAKAVVATLWPVADTSTGLFMRRLYKLRDEGGLSKAESIRQVQLEFLKPDSPYQHPLFWAPFILMGNWL